MTKDDIIRMAREAGLHAPEGRTYILSPTIHPDDDLSEYLERFAALVASAERNRTWTQSHWTEYERAIVAQEREACADMVYRYISQTDNMEARGCLASVAYDIRARGQA